MPVIKEIWVDSLPDNCPALQVTQGNKHEIYYSRERLGNLSNDLFQFIRSHELAHIKFDTDDEIQCDAWAFYECMSKGISTHRAIEAISRILDFEHPNPDVKAFNWLRFQKQEERALLYEQLQKNI
ncbi:hypothetical protein QQ054_01055 [Oscillatoria amoena NRMC-F 0135]|nr:hypothetical protein [Oscillatoria amoena NRMC-F 0135]